MRQRLFVVGMGPGDPRLLTRRAAEVLSEAAVVAYPVTGRGSLALRIAEAFWADVPRTPPERLPFDLPMTADGAAEAAYDAAAQRIDTALGAATVALLCEGDPMLYGSAASILARLSLPADGVEIVPGVAGFSAAAARTGLSLTRGERPFTIVPATAGRAAVRRALAAGGGAAIYKVGRHFPAVREAVKAAGRGEDATLVVRAGWDEERIEPLHSASEAPKPYFSTILVPAQAARRRREPGVAVVVLSEAALGTARAVAAAFDAEGQTIRLHGLAGRLSPGEVDEVFDDTLSHLADLAAAGQAIVGLCAAGILVRAVGPSLGEKGEEPPVLAVAADGSAVVPLLGTHRGGARLARLAAEALGVAPTFTSLSDTTHGVALDDPPRGYRVADPAPFKTLAARLGADPSAGIAPEGPLPFLRALPRGDAPVVLTVWPAQSATTPTYIPQCVALGMGAERGADPGEAVAAAHAALEAARIDPRAVALIATLDVKADEAALLTLAERLDVPLRVFARDRLEQEDSRLARPSETVRAAVGLRGVAEAAALAAAGPTGRLVLPKQVCGRVTVALAQADAPLDPTVGRARGRLAIVGVGPGAPQWRTREAVDALAQAEDFVGYSLYLDLVEDRRGRRLRHDYPLGAEVERVRFALERAGAGRNVALISSGDPQIYAMASLAMELLHGTALSEGARRVALRVVPGISAAQAAAARIGAPLGHDFAYLSLSDLMTPWSTIRQRAEALAAADFVVALYNPRSERRRDQLAEALAIFARHRPPSTPVVRAVRLGRPGEVVTAETLATLDPSSVDMLTTLIVGASTSAAFTRGDGARLVYTPRGYAP